MRTILQAALALAVLAITAWPAGAQSSHDNVVIILDASGSMRQKMGSMPVKKMEAAKAALKKVMTQVSESTRVALLVFGDRHPKRWLYPLGPRDQQQLTAAVDSVRPGGGTPLGAFMKIGADRLLQERAKQFGYGSYRLLIVTDGEANDQNVVDRYAPEIIARGLTVDVIGVDMKQDHTLATQVHSYRRADDPQALQQALAEVFAEVSSIAGADAQAVDFELLEGIPMEIATAMVTALAKPDNKPIGERPPAPPTREALRQKQKRRAGKKAPAQPASSPAPQPAQPVSSMLPKLVVTGIAMLLIITVVRNARRRR